MTMASITLQLKLISTVLNEHKINDVPLHAKVQYLQENTVQFYTEEVSLYALFDTLTPQKQV